MHKVAKFLTIFLGIPIVFISAAILAILVATGNVWGERILIGILMGIWAAMALAFSG